MTTRTSTAQLEEQRAVIPSAPPPDPGCPDRVVGGGGTELVGDRVTQSVAVPLPGSRFQLFVL
jgi:hypothetical protein